MYGGLPDFQRDSIGRTKGNSLTFSSVCQPPAGTIYDYNYCRPLKPQSHQDLAELLFPRQNQTPTDHLTTWRFKVRGLDAVQGPTPLQSNRIRICTFTVPFQISFLCRKQTASWFFKRDSDPREKPRRRYREKKKTHKFRHLMLLAPPSPPTQECTYFASPLKIAVRTGIICISIFLSWWKEENARMGGSRAAAFSHMLKRKKK